MTRNIGLPVKESKKKIEENEKNKQFNRTSVNYTHLRDQETRGNLV